MKKRTIAQVESMDEALRTALWNATYGQVLSPQYFFNGVGHAVSTAVWQYHLHWNVTQAPESSSDAIQKYAPIFAEGEWYEVYDLVQAFLEEADNPRLTAAYNYALETHVAGYRVVNNEIVPLTGQPEVEAIETALADSSPYAGVRHSLETALTLYSRREDPDYANSIKESISAVEAMVKELTGRSPLGDGLAQLKKNRADLHPALVKGWAALYGFASDADAIRHGGFTGPAFTQADARYFLVTCSAFVNLLITLA